MPIRFEVDHRAFEAEIDRLVETALVRDDLEDVLDDQFDTAQSLVHVHAGDLKASGRRSSEWSALNKQWTGEISWSDPAATHEIYVNDERDPGKGHADFWNSLRAWDDEYLRALHRHLRGDSE